MASDAALSVSRADSLRLALIAASSGFGQSALLALVPIVTERTGLASPQIGAVAFLLGAGSADAARTWSIYLVNLVFWAGLAATGPAIAAMMQLTEARWSPSVRRLAVTTVGFLPVAFVLLLVLFFGREVLYAWVRNPIPVKAAWLNTP